MTRWPATPPPIVSTLGIYGPPTYMGSGGSMASNWVTNLAVYVPMRFPIPIPVKKLVWVNGTTVTGNIDIGIYDSAGNRLVSTGSISPGTASQLTSADVSDLVLTPGNYYFAAWRASTGRLWLVNCLGQPHTVAIGCREQTGQSALPSTATFATPASGAYIPWVGVDTVGVT